MGTYYTYQDKKGSVYPGEYIPLLDATTLIEDLKKPHERQRQPFVNVCEQPDHYKIEVAIPGFKREDFFVSITDNILAIVAINKTFPNTEEGIFQLHEFNYEPLEHTIILPGNADTEFVRAEYQAGILTIHMTKTTFSTRQAPTQVVVY